MKRIWKLSYEGKYVKYEISNFGEVRKNGIIYECKLCDGYKYFNHKALHRELFKLFLLKKGEIIGSEYDIHHRDFNKLNNNVLNLQKLTKSEHSKIHWKDKNFRNNMSKMKLGNLNPSFRKPGYFLGHEHTKETKIKISNSMKGKKHAKEVKIKISNSMKGKLIGSKNGNSILTLKDVIQIKMLLNLSISIKRIAEFFNVSCGTISDIKFERSWKHVNFKGR